MKDGEYPGGVPWMEYPGKGSTKNKGATRDFHFNIVISTALVRLISAILSEQKYREVAIPFRI